MAELAEVEIQDHRGPQRSTRFVLPGTNRFFVRRRAHAHVRAHGTQPRIVTGLVSVLQRRRCRLRSNAGRCAAQALPQSSRHCQPARASSEVRPLRYGGSCGFRLC